MILTQDQSQRFLAAADAFVEYAAARAGMTGRLHPQGPSCEPDPFGRQEVCSWVWDEGHLDVIPAFVAENPAGLPKEDLQEVGRWASGVSDHFIVMRDGDRSIFIVEGLAVEVAGIGYEAYEAFHNPPVYSMGVLVPFEDKVTYLIDLGDFGIDMGASMRKLLQDELDERMSTGQVITTADAFLRAVPAILESQASFEEESQAMQEYGRTGPSQAYLDGLEGMPQGQHRGALAGLPWEERSRIVDESLRSQLLDVLGIGGSERLALLKPPVVSDLVGLLGRLKKDQIKDIAYRAGMSGISKLRKAELAEATAAAIMADADGFVEDALGSMDPDELGFLRRVAEAGGCLEVSSDEVPETPDGHMWCDVLPACFATGGTVTCVVPGELREALGAVDWDEAQAQAQADDQQMREALDGLLGLRPDGSEEGGDVLSAGRYAELLVSLRGLVPITSAATEYLAYRRKMEPDGTRGMKPQDVVQQVRDDWSAHADYVGYEIVPAGRETYLLANDIAETNFMEVTGIERPEDGSPYPEGYPGEGLGPSVRSLMAHQALFKPRPMPEDLAREGAYLDWAIQQPPVRRLARYLDAHVPDGEDDVLYAEQVIDLVVDMSHGGYEVMELMQDLGTMGAFTDKDSTSAVVWLVTEVMNGMPHWDDNGWSPDEARQMEEETRPKRERRERKPRPRKKHRR